MNKFAKFAALSLLIVLICVPVVAFAQDAAPSDQAAGVAAAEESADAGLTALYGVGCGVVMLGAGFGIGKIGSSAVESIARQPEAASKIQTAMIISAALVEGVTFFALIICMLK